MMPVRRIGIGVYVAPAQPSHDAVGVRVVRSHKDVHEAVVVDDTRRGRVRGLTGLGRLGLQDILDADSVAPDFLVITSVEHGRLRDAIRAGDAGCRRGADDQG